MLHLKQMVEWKQGMRSNQRLTVGTMG